MRSRVAFPGRRQPGNRPEAFANQGFFRAVQRRRACRGCPQRPDSAPRRRLPRDLLAARGRCTRSSGPLLRRPAAATGRRGRREAVSVAPVELPRHGHVRSITSRQRRRSTTSGPADGVRAVLPDAFAMTRIPDGTYASAVLPSHPQVGFPRSFIETQWQAHADAKDVAVHPGEVDAAPCEAGDARGAA